MQAAASLNFFPVRAWSTVVTHVERLLEGSSGLVGVALLDVDGFAETARQLSNRGGDPSALIDSLAHHFCRQLAPSDFTARIGDDDLVIVRPSLQAPAEMEGLGLRLVESLQHPLEIDDDQISIAISAGVATSHRGDEAKELLGYAQFALSDAKALGRNQLVAFDDEDRELLADIGMDDPAGRR